uniref:Uncharacterized protein n=1 Tax=Octactis speculum TaxID=3111310 RepID=A0A7S2H8M8_9STRA
MSLVIEGKLIYRIPNYFRSEKSVKAIVENEMIDGGRAKERQRGRTMDISSRVNRHMDLVLRGHKDQILEIKNQMLANKNGILEIKEIIQDRPPGTLTQAPETPNGSWYAY